MDEDEQLLLIAPAVLDEFHHVSFTTIQSCKLVLCGAIAYLGPLQLLCDRSGMVVGVGVDVDVDDVVIYLL